MQDDKEPDIIEKNLQKGYQYFSQWYEDNGGDLDNFEIYEAFPDQSRSTLRGYKARFHREKELLESVQTAKTKHTRAGGILPTPLWYGDNLDYGIVEYIQKFDGINEKMEIMIPFEVLFDPEENKKLGKKVELSRDAQKRKNKFRFA